MYRYHLSNLGCRKGHKCVISGLCCSVSEIFTVLGLSQMCVCVFWGGGGAVVLVREGYNINLCTVL